VGHQPAGFADLELTAADRLFARQAQPLEQLLGAMLHRLEHLGVSVAAHHVIHPVAARGLQADVHRIGAAKQVVQIAHHLLVGPRQKQANPVGLAGAQFMQLEQRFDLAAVDEALELAIRIAGQIGKAAQRRGPLIEPLDRHHWKQLIDRPGVGG